VAVAVVANMIKTTIIMPIKNNLVEVVAVN
jgi:hypothetical protein